MARKRSSNPDVLDRQSFTLLWTLYALPGRIYLWFRYILAPKGKVFATSRQARSPIVVFFYSTIFWLIIGFCIYIYYTESGANQTVSYSQGYTS